MNPVPATIVPKNPDRPAGTPPVPASEPFPLDNSGLPLYLNVEVGRGRRPGQTRRLP